MTTSIKESGHDLGRGWIILAMMVIFMMINFGDKAVLGLSAAHIMKDLHLTHAQFGEVGSAFFLLFSVSAVIVGVAVDRFSTKAVLALMALIWAAMQMPMVGTVSLETFLVTRIGLGAGEGPAFPVALHAVYKWFPHDRRAVPTSFVSIGAPLGIATLSPLLTWIIVHYSWHAAFGFLGIIGFVWLAVWLAVGKEGPLGAHRIEAGAEGLDRVPYAALLTSRTFLGVTLAGFAAYWALAVAIVWLPSFLGKVGGYSPTAIGWIVVLPPLLQIVLSPAIGAYSQNLRTRGVSSRIAGGLFTSGSVLVAGIAMMLLSRTSGGFTTISLAMIAFAVCAVTWAIGPTLIGEISPVHQRGAALGISNGLFSTAGLIAPWLMGHIVDVGTNPVQGFKNAFLYAGLLIVAGSAVAMALIHPERDIERFKNGVALDKREGLPTLRS